MTARFLVVPQWQGSGSARAMRLVDGAEAIGGDLPAASTVRVDVPLEAGDAEGTSVLRYSSIALVRDRLARALAEGQGPAITIGGDCGVELAAIAHAASPEVAVVWFDAHADLNTPETSLSGAFHGMVLRTLLGDGPAGLVPEKPLAPERLILVGARAFDLAEDDYVAAHGVTSIPADGVTAAALIAAVESTGATRVYVHIDVDVIDPSEIAGVGFPEPFGIPASDLVAAVRGLTERFPLAGAGITEFAPSSPEDAVEDLPTLLRLIGALAAAA